MELHDRDESRRAASCFIQFKRRCNIEGPETLESVLMGAKVVTMAAGATILVYGVACVVREHYYRAGLEVRRLGPSTPSDPRKPPQEDAEKTAADQYLRRL